MNNLTLKISRWDVSNRAVILILFILLVIVIRLCGNERNSDENDAGVRAEYSFNLVNNSEYRLEYDHIVSGTLTEINDAPPSSSARLTIQGTTFNVSATVVYNVMNPITGSLIGQLQFTLYTWLYVAPETVLRLYRVRDVSSSSTAIGWDTDSNTITVMNS
ncbi:hypothetical protein M3223_07615 [Paenibacillus pasadenensis]|uniref:hypothetical protein n=1 Tax=Paenibacillus pasadenensis TaxID=217090 RepID=UPI002042608D|nr:hypothetical protein [Paenibacillus pasadenensis]MCM3747221.1 hypothetical protein [Paenibacillus pasadenensis]